MSMACKLVLLVASMAALQAQGRDMEEKKKIAAKTIEKTSRIVAISKDLTRPTHGDGSVELSNEITLGCGILPEINTMSCINPTPQKDIGGLQEGCEIDDLQDGYVEAIGHGSTNDSIMNENPVLSIVLGNPSDGNMFVSDSSTQYGTKEAKLDECATNVEQGIGEELSGGILVTADNAKVDSLPSAKSCEATEHDDQLCKHNTTAIMECVTGDVALTENLSLYPSMVDGVVLNELLSDENSKVKNKNDMEKENHQGNVVGLPSDGPESHQANIDVPPSASLVEVDIVLMESSTENSAFIEQHAVSQQYLSSAITQLSSINTSNCTESECYNSLTIPEGVEGTPTPKHFTSRTDDSFCPFSRSSVPLHGNTADIQVSQSLAIENLPFVKTNPMWAEIEAMQIFSKYPQRPNFRQFQQYAPEVREGMALGLMVSFASLAGSVDILNVDNDKELFEEKMKSLSLLEGNGFDVRDLRSRLESLLNMKNVGAGLQVARTKLEAKIALKEAEDRRAASQLGILNKAIHQVGLDVYLLQSMRRSAVLQRMDNAVEISRLKKEASELERSYLSTEVIAPLLQVPIFRVSSK